MTGFDDFPHLSDGWDRKFSECVPLGWVKFLFRKLQTIALYWLVHELRHKSPKSPVYRFLIQGRYNIFLALDRLPWITAVV